MGNHLHVLSGEPAKLVEIAEGIEECSTPRVATACGVSGLSEPKRFASLELVPELTVKREGFVSPPEPLLRESGVGCSLMAHRRATYRSCAVVVVREAIDARSGCGEQIAGFQHF